MDTLRYWMALLAVLLVPALAWAGADAITPLGASQIGDNAVRAVHHDPEMYDRTIALFDTPENGILPAHGESEPVRLIRLKLANHTYWAVHYHPKDKKDGELAVFIDSGTGAILGIYTGR